MKRSTALSLLADINKFCLLNGIGILFCFAATAQFTVTIHLDKFPPVQADEHIYVAGSFNNWNPADNNAKFSKAAPANTATLKGLPAGLYQFKFTKGGWEKVECSAAGADVANHTLQLTSDTSVTYDITGWMNYFASAPKQHTASANVQVLDSAFAIPQLQKTRRIWIYLPNGYANNKKRYPVMYLHDGQNVFDAYTSGYGEWGVDECLDSLIAMGKPPCIVVGIDNGGESRMNEYNPYPFILKDSTSSKTFLPQGDAYVSFLVETLKPYIDGHYRTIASKENTIIAGSSMGGLISYYAALKYPEVFGKAGIFSPAFWIAQDSIQPFTDSLGSRIKGKFFFYMGGKEGEEYLQDMNDLQEKIGSSSSAMIYSMIDPDGKHNEAAWQKWFPEFYSWIMADGYNVITKGQD